MTLLSRLLVLMHSPLLIQLHQKKAEVLLAPVVLAGELRTAAP